MANPLELRLFTRRTFGSPDDATRLVRLLASAGASLAPSRWGHCLLHQSHAKHLKEALDPADVTAPAAELARSGGLTLRGAKHGLMIDVGSREGAVSTWTILLNRAFLDSARRREELFALLAALCDAFPPLYGGAAPEEDWGAKHDLREGYSVRSRVGRTVEACLPGVYWLTVFGPELVARFGRERLLGLGAHRVLDLGAGGLGLVLREAPDAPELDARLALDRAVVDALGAEHFFDVREPRRPRVAIPGVTTGGPALAPDPPRPDEVLARLSTADLPGPDGEPLRGADGMAALAAELPALLGGRVDFTLGEDALLTAIESDLLHHPEPGGPERRVAALAAHLGGALVRAAGGAWRIREPLLASTVEADGQEVPVLARAVGAVHGHAPLAALVADFGPAPSADLLAFEAQPVHALDSRRQLRGLEGLRDLAEGHVVGVAEDGLGHPGFTRADVVRLDAHLRRRPFRHTYKPGFLVQQVIPALGAWLGEVLVRELGARWEPRAPLGASTVRAGDHEVAVFRAAWRAVQQDAGLTGVYDRAAALATGGEID